MSKEQKLRTTILALDAATKQSMGDFKEVKREIAATRSSTNPPFSHLKKAVYEAEKDTSPEIAANIKDKMDEYERERKKDEFVSELIEENMDEPETEIMTLKVDAAEVEHHV